MDIRKCSKSDLDALNVEIARHKANRNSQEVREEKQKDVVNLFSQSTNTPEQLDLFGN
jgi:hypothetical protein